MAPLSVQSKKLLNRVVEYYRHSLSADSPGLKYLRDHLQLHHNLVIEDCRIGYSDGSLVGTLPEDPSVLSDLRYLGILDKHNDDKLENCLVVPLTDASGDIINLYAKNTITHRSRFIRKSGAGVLNPRAFKAFDCVLIAPSVSDVLVFYDLGIQNCVYIYCGGKINEADAFYSSNNLKHAFIIRFNASGERPCHRRLCGLLKEKGIGVHNLCLPYHCAKKYFNKHTLKDFRQRYEREKKKISHPASKSPTQRFQIKQTSDGFVLIASGIRKYEIKAISKKATQLKVTIKASLNQGGSTPFELSTVDMYSYRARIWFAKLCAELFAEPEDIIQLDLQHILERAENNHRPEPQGRTHISAEDKKQALAFLTDPKLMDQILLDFEAIGVVGEQTNKLVGYLAAVSRKLDEPLSVLIQSRSAAGKSTLQDAIIKLVPDEDVLKYTRITDQALFYSGTNTFAHKILAIEEGPGMKGAAYSIRNIQSSGQITIAAAGKTQGSDGMKTRQYTVKGPVSVMLTTTATSLDEETASRFIVLTIDESSQMTRAIHQLHRRREALNSIVGQKQIRRLMLKHHNAQRLLKPIAVINPYAKHLSFPDGYLKARRDFKKYLGLIKAVAFLHQYQRDLKTASVDGSDHPYIEVTLQDIEQANALAKQVLEHSLDDMPIPSRQLLSLIFDMVSALAKDRQLPLAKVSFTRRMIREHTGWSNWQIRNYLPPLLDFEYLVIQSSSRVNRYSYAVNTTQKDIGTTKAGLQLTPVSELKEKLETDASQFHNRTRNE